MIPSLNLIKLIKLEELTGIIKSPVFSNAFQTFVFGVNDLKSAEHSILENLLSYFI